MVRTQGVLKPRLMNQYVVSGATLEAPGIVKRNGVCTSTLAFSLAPVQLTDHHRCTGFSHPTQAVGTQTRTRLSMPLYVFSRIPKPSKQTDTDSAYLVVPIRTLVFAGRHRDPERKDLVLAERVRPPARVKRHLYGRPMAVEPSRFEHVHLVPT